MGGLDDNLRTFLEIALAIVGFLLNRSLKRIDDDLKEIKEASHQDLIRLRKSAHDIRDKLQTLALKISVLEEWRRIEERRKYQP